MPLPPELTRIPPGAVEVLRYMGYAGLDSADTDTLAQGTGMSSRAVGRAIRGLVTKSYLTMDDNYVYFLTETGRKAIEDIQTADAEGGVETEPMPRFNSSIIEMLDESVIAVGPQPIGAAETTTLQLGLQGTPDVSEASQLVLRLTASSGSVSPPEVVLKLAPGEEIEPGEIYYTPDEQHGTVRFRVEAVQLIGMADVHQAGGMYFDVPLAANSGGLQAWYGQLSLRP